jgi:hypothetical protein
MHVAGVSGDAHRDGQAPTRGPNISPDDKKTDGVAAQIKQCSISGDGIGTFCKL